MSEAQAGVFVWIKARRHLLSGGFELVVGGGRGSDDDGWQDYTLREIVTLEAWARLPGYDDADRARAAAYNMVCASKRMRALLLGEEDQAGYLPQEAIRQLTSGGIVSVDDD